MSQGNRTLYNQVLKKNMINVSENCVNLFRVNCVNLLRYED